MVNSTKTIFWSEESFGDNCRLTYKAIVAALIKSKMPKIIFLAKQKLSLTFSRKSVRCLKYTRGKRYRAEDNPNFKSTKTR
jgi:hypothetical protein